MTAPTDLSTEALEVLLAETTPVRQGLVVRSRRGLTPIGSITLGAGP